MTVRWKKAVSVIIAAIFASSCGGSNYFADLSHKDSDEAIYHEIDKLMNAQQWDAAIARFGELSSEFRSRPDVVLQHASAYSGKCGVKFVDFVQGIGGSGALFSILMHAFDGKTIDPDACQSAQEIIEDALGDTAAARSAAYPSQANSINLYMAILGMAKIGTTLKAAADADDDGVIDATFTNACTNNAANLENPEVVRVGTGFAMIMDNFTAIADRLDSGSSQFLTDLADECSALNPNPCTIADDDNAAWSDPLILLAFRGMVKSDDIGLGGCANGNPFLCCP